MRKGSFTNGVRGEREGGEGGVGRLKNAEDSYGTLV